MDKLSSLIEIVGNPPWEFEIKGFTIFIDENRDTHSGGYEWSVCKEGLEVFNGLDFSVEQAKESLLDEISHYTETE